ncbi:hypothetical protein GCM10022221_68340 [Actinocorallia aurea]
MTSPPDMPVREGLKLLAAGGAASIAVYWMTEPAFGQRFGLIVVGAGLIATGACLVVGMLRARAGDREFAGLGDTHLSATPPAEPAVGSGFAVGDDARPVTPAR